MGTNFGAWGQCCFAATFLLIGAGVPAAAILLGPRLMAPLQSSLHAISATFPSLRATILMVVLAVLAAAIVWSLVRWRRNAVAFWMLLVVSVTVTPCWYFVNEWLVKSLREDRGLGQAKIAVILTIILLAADMGNLASGAAIKLLVHRGWSLRAARGTAMIAAACLVMPVAVVSRVESLPLATAIFGLAGFGLTSIVAGGLACQQDLSFRRVGLMTGVVGTCANIVSALANPAIGAYHDRTHSYGLMFVLLGTLPMLSAAAIVVFDAIVHGTTNGRHAD